MITINIDGASRGNPGPASIGIAFYKDKELIEEMSEHIGICTNNFAEYTALIRALETSLNKGFDTIEVRSDSELVVNQINKRYKVKDADIKELFDKANSLIEKFHSFKIIYVPREENLRADKLANKALKG
ncbi:MAG: ribonuclease HI family protein [Candidatus Melainabacteria bacterium]|nr:ribonuclease HI family protein [Candidatus Melainabacteria bacterium]